MHKYILTFDPEYDMLRSGEVSKDWRFYGEITLDFKPVLGVL